MALTLYTDTYYSVDDIQAWLDARGYSVTVTEAAVLRAMDYIESLPWASEREDETSDLFWNEDPPDAVIAALCQASRLEVETPQTLFQDSAQRIKRKKIDVLETEYESGGYTKTHDIIQQYLGSYLRSFSSRTLSLL